MSGVMALCAVALFLVGGFMAIAGGTDIHLGLGFVVMGLGVVAFGIGGLIDAVSNVRKEVERQTS